MVERAVATRTLGLQRTGSHLRGVVLEYRRRQIVCDGIFIIDSGEDNETLTPLYLTDGGKALEKQTHKSLVVTAIDGSQTIVRQLDVKLKKEKDIDAILAFQAEPLLPFSVEEGQIDRVFVEHNEIGTLLTVLAVRNDHLHSHLEEWRSLGIEPEVVGAVPQALAAFAGVFVEDIHEPCLVIDIGYVSTHCALVRAGKLLAAQSYRGGIRDLIAAYRRDKGNGIDIDATAMAILDYGKIHAAQLPTVAQTVAKMQRDAVRTAFGLAKYSHIGDIHSVVATGEGILYPSLFQGILQAIGKPLQLLTIPPSITVDEQELCRLAIPVGLALSALPIGDRQVNFRQGAMAYPHPWKRLRVPLAIAMTLALLLAVACYLFGHAYLERRQQLLQGSYVDLVSDLKREYNAVEKQFPEGGVNPSELTPQAIEQRLNLLERESAVAPDTIALFPNVPRVSDILAWLSSHPESGAMQIDSFSYRMIKRPELNKAHDHYQVQVEIEFSSQSPRAARLFYDSLIAPNNIVDPKSEVKWTAANGKYRVAFFLKDKTIYPNL